MGVALSGTVLGPWLAGWVSWPVNLPADSLAAHWYEVIHAEQPQIAEQRAGYVLRVTETWACAWSGGLLGAERERLPGHLTAPYQLYCIVCAVLDLCRPLATMLAP